MTSRSAGIEDSSALGVDAVPDSLARFVDDVAVLRMTRLDQHRLTRAIARRLKRLIADPAWLPEQHRQPAPDRYRQHVVYVAPDGGYSVVALVWLPGQSTPIHDHVAWCVVGVYEGAEQETRFKLCLDKANREPFLVEAGKRTVRPGQTVALLPPTENIHRVTNCSDRRAISIHVYGADIVKLGSSIDRCFEGLPIRPSEP